MTDNRVILEAGGVCRTADLIASGVTKQTIRRALDANLLVRVRQGIYCSDASPLAATAAQHGGRPCMCSAASFLVDSKASLKNIAPQEK